MLLPQRNQICTKCCLEVTALSRLSNEGGGVVWDPKVRVPKMAQPDFVNSLPPFVNFLFSHDGHFGLEGGGGPGGVPPLLLRWTAILILPPGGGGLRRGQRGQCSHSTSGQSEAGCAAARRRRALDVAPPLVCGGGGVKGAWHDAGLGRCLMLAAPTGPSPLTPPPPPFVIATPKYGINTVPTPTVAITRAWLAHNTYNYLHTRERMV